MSKYIIGVDGGGTKTLGILFDYDGNTKKRVVSGFGNFSVNIEETINHLLSVLEELTEDVEKLAIKFIQIGIAGYSNFNDKEQLNEKLSKLYNCEVSIVTDAEIALYSIKKDSEKNVIMVLGGTGSAVMYDYLGKTQLIGGFGHLLGDEGSGYHLAITALKNIIKQYEERKPITPLTKSILKQINAKNYSEIKNFVYNNKKTEIAKLSEYIAQHANDGDSEAIKLFIDEGRLLAKQTIQAYKALESNNEVIVGIKGGFLLNAPYVKESLIEELNAKNIKYKLDASSVEPVVGAYYLAKSHLVKR